MNQGKPRSGIILFDILYDQIKAKIALSTYPPFCAIIMNYRLQKGVFSLDNTSENKPKKHICAALLAHVDAGKTTLSEAILYVCGELRELGRVDRGDAFLDTSPLERERGITIFSKQAELTWKEREITLLDTPGHADFSAEMERTLQVLDYAVLVISGTDGVQGHTETLWKLLKKNGIPVFIFVNKMDLPGTDRAALMEGLGNRLSERCVDFSDMGSEGFFEQVAVCEEALLEKYIENGTLDRERDLVPAVAGRSVFPCFFGSALRLDGVEAFLDGFSDLTTDVERGSEFGAQVYKITRDTQGTRLTHMKITGGELRVKTEITKKGVSAGEKVNQIRIYSGEKYTTRDVVYAGDVCAVTGLNTTYSGQGLGVCPDFSGEQLEPVLNYRILFSEGTDMVTALKQMRQLEDEDPKLHIVWEESSHSMYVQPMGEVQLEVLKSVIHERFHMNVTFGEGSIRYKETIAGCVEGVGHFEPLRHYAEVHLWMEPLPAGSGLVLAADCSEDELDLNWQRLVLTHLAEKEFLGVLTGSPITDLKITVAAGKAHVKHTEGGDFRQATYRAVRQGLRQAESVLLEPFYNFRIELPPENIGRAMTDIKRMHGEFESYPERDGRSVLTGKCPVSTMKEYPVTFASYTKGRGFISCSIGGYQPCHNAEEVIAQIGYDCGSDVENTADSVFCAHGSGIVVPWNEVGAHMHVGSVADRFRACSSEVEQTEKKGGTRDMSQRSGGASQDFYAEEKELQAIFERTYGPVRRQPGHTESRSIGSRQVKPPVRRARERKWDQMEDYLLVDGYNIIFAWEDLKELSKFSLDAARMRLMDMLCNYQGYAGCKLIVVFDAYKVKGNPGSLEMYHNISVVYTKEAETADMYIEKTTEQIAKRHRVRVATSDGMEQMIILGHGAVRVSAAAFREEMEQVNGRIREELDMK